MEQPIEDAFHQAMVELHKQGSRVLGGRFGSAFLNMVNQYGGKEAADRLLLGRTPSEGFANLFLSGKENLVHSVEHLVLRDPWHTLFDEDQLEEAKCRLNEVDCPIPESGANLDANRDTPSTERSQPPPVQLIPMSASDEFAGWSIEDIQQQFFLVEILYREPPGTYFLRAKGVNAGPGTVLLFQTHGKVIASGVLIGQYEVSGTASEPRKSLLLDPSSILVFEPVDAAFIQRFWPDFKNFSQAKQKLAADGYEGFLRSIRVTGSSSQGLSLPGDEVSDATYAEGSVKKILTNAYERNPKARAACIEHHKAVCAICEFDFGSTYGQVAAGFIHVHHKKQLARCHTFTRSE